MANRIRLTLTSFLAYAVMAGMLSQIGIMINPMAEHFGNDVTEIASLFSWLTVGILIGSIVSLGIFDLVKIKTLNTIVLTSIILSIIGMSLADNLTANSIFLGIIGLSCGIALPAAAIVIARTYQTQHRATMLVITDASFSLSGALCSALAVMYFASGMNWSSGFSTVAILAFVALFITLFSTYPEVEAEEKLRPLEEIRSWPASIYLCMGALFVYLLGQNFILIWLPAYAETHEGVTSDQAGALLSNFWAGMFIGQLIAVALLIKIRVALLAFVASILAFVATLPLWLLEDISLLSTVTFLWGMFTLGLLKLILSWATEMVSTPSPRLISGLLMAATLGTAVSPALSSQLVALTNIQMPIQVGSICFFLVSALVVSARIKR
ncbi:MAG: MFS transporter TsgA [Pseudomonadales bacterium]|jgi:TsgA-like MFS transporter